jgi:ketosteroid isomerase-like protein
MNELERMLIAEACRETILRATAATDANDAAAFARCFTDEAVLERPNTAPVTGRDAIREVYARRPPDRLTRHLVTNILVEAQGPDAARATSLVLLWSGSTHDTIGPQGRPADGRQVVGEFHDELARGPDGWRIARRKALFVLFHDN